MNCAIFLFLGEMTFLQFEEFLEEKLEEPPKGQEEAESDTPVIEEEPEEVGEEKKETPQESQENQEGKNLIAVINKLLRCQGQQCLGAHTKGVTFVLI